MTDNKQKSQNVLAMPERIVSQEDLIELLSLKLLYENKRSAIMEALKSGARIETGVHVARLESKLTVR